MHSHAPLPNVKPSSQLPAVATTMPSSRGNRPVRTAKQVKPAPGYVDSSTLLFDSEDEGIESEREHDSDAQGNNKDDDEDRHIAKKPRLKMELKAQAKVAPPPPDSSCLAYYPETYAAVQRFNKILGLPPPNPMGDAPTTNVPAREREDDVDAPKFSSSTKYLQPSSEGLPSFRLVTAIKKNIFYDETKAGFESLPGELRNQIYALVFKKRAPIDFIDRDGFARSAALLRVNKLVYNEARPFVYSENRFSFGYNPSKTGDYFEPDWKALGWSHIRRFLTDIGPENTGLIKNLGILFSDAIQSNRPYVELDQRRFTYNEDVLWILKYLGQHGKLLKLRIGFCGRRAVRMSPRDGDFLNALSGVKTDTLAIGDPFSEVPSSFGIRWYSKADLLARELLKAVMVRPLPLEDLDPRLKF